MCNKMTQTTVSHLEHESLKIRRDMNTNTTIFVYEIKIHDSMHARIVHIMGCFIAAFWSSVVSVNANCGSDSLVVTSIYAEKLRPSV